MKHVQGFVMSKQLDINWFHAKLQWISKFCAPLGHNAFFQTEFGIMAKFWPNSTFLSSLYGTL
jgi:hypothetical protein